MPFLKQQVASLCAGCRAQRHWHMYLALPVNGCTEATKTKHTSLGIETQAEVFARLEFTVYRKKKCKFRGQCSDIDSIHTAQRYHSQRVSFKQAGRF